MNSCRLKDNDITFVAIFLVFFCAVSPFIAGIFILAVSPFFRSRLFLLFGVFCVVIGFVLMNLHKVIENDLYWYSQHYFLNYGASISSVFELRAGVVARWSEPVYHLFSYYLSNMFAADYNIYVVSVTSFIYFGAIYFLFSFAVYCGLNFKQRMFLVVFFLFFGPIFTQSLHLIRQYFACVFLMGMYVSMVRRKAFPAFIFTLLASLTHSSTLIVVLLFYSVLFIEAKFKGRFFRLISCGLFSALFGCVYILGFILLGSSERLLIDDGSVSVLVKAIDFSLFFISLLLFVRRKVPTRADNFVFYLYFSFCVFLGFMHYSHFLSLRYYFFLDFFRWVPVLVVLRSFSLEARTYVVTYFCMLSIGVLYLYIRILSSPFDFQYSFEEYLVYPVSLLFK